MSSAQTIVQRSARFRGRRKFINRSLDSCVVLPPGTPCQPRPENIQHHINGIMSAERKYSSTQRVLKRSIDLTLSLALLLFLSPLFVVLALLILLDNGWPLIYRRRVGGQKGEFDAFKFRSMRRDADMVLANDPALRSEFEKNFKLKNDPRLTRLGNDLRRSSLDELPQLLNVLKGQMSL